MSTIFFLGPGVPGGNSRSREFLRRLTNQRLTQPEVLLSAMTDRSRDQSPPTIGARAMMSFVSDASVELVGALSSIC